MLLSKLKVLDLTGYEGWFCGKILADFGADVIKIEPPGGDPSRNMGPFYHDIPDPEKSLNWFAYNIGKRGITLNLETSEGVELFKKLAAGADFVIESFRPGYMENLGLGYEQLSQIEPRVILTSITPFGQTGPYRDYQSSDLIMAAMGGMLYLTGDTDRPPVRISQEQSHLLASAHAAAATMIAHLYREAVGEGQHVDVSIQAAVTRVMAHELYYWTLNQHVCRRKGSKRERGGVEQSLVWDCADGQLAFSVMGGNYTSGVKPLADWMKEEGLAGVLGSIQDWTGVNLSQMSQEQMDAWETAFNNFFMRHTKAEMAEGAVKRQIYLAPVYTFEDIHNDSHLEARGFWSELEHPELNCNITYVGIPHRVSDSRPSHTRRAPLIGEHNCEIYSELGISPQELSKFKADNVI